MTKLTPSTRPRILIGRFLVTFMALTDLVLLIGYYSRSKALNSDEQVIVPLLVTRILFAILSRVLDSVRTRGGYYFQRLRAIPKSTYWFWAFMLMIGMKIPFRDRFVDVPDILRWFDIGVLILIVTMFVFYLEDRTWTPEDRLSANKRQSALLKKAGLNADEADLVRRRVISDAKPAKSAPIIWKVVKWFVGSVIVAAFIDAIGKSLIDIPAAMGLFRDILPPFNP